MLDIVASIDPSMSITKPKGKTLRRVAIDSGTVAALKKCKHIQRQELIKIGIEQGNSTPVCSAETGGYINPNNFSRWWRRFTDKNGFKGLRFHELRHSMATVLLGNGLDVEAVSKRLGHADASITLKLYTHRIEENDRKAANMVESLFEGPSTSSKRDSFAHDLHTEGENSAKKQNRPPSLPR